MCYYHNTTLLAATNLAVAATNLLLLVCYCGTTNVYIFVKCLCVRVFVWYNFVHLESRI